MLDNDRLDAGHDRSGEALANRDTNSLAYLRLDSSCGGGDQLVGVLIEQEYGRSIDLEELSQPPEQLVQEAFHIQVGKRLVGHRLDTTQPFGLGVDVAHVTGPAQSCSSPLGESAPRPRQPCPLRYVPHPRRG